MLCEKFCYGLKVLTLSDFFKLNRAVCTEQAGVKACLDLANMRTLLSPGHESTSPHVLSPAAPVEHPTMPSHSHPLPPGLPSSSVAHSRFCTIFPSIRYVYIFYLFFTFFGLFFYDFLINLIL